VIHAGMPSLEGMLPEADNAPSRDSDASPRSDVHLNGSTFAIARTLRLVLIGEILMRCSAQRGFMDAS
jgi:hypothetical protein